MTKTDLARTYRRKNPTYPTRKLARIMYADNKLLFKDEEAVREVLRRIENKSGGRMGRETKDPVKRAFFLEKARPLNPYNLPESFKEDRPPFKLPLACNNVLLISDLHIPYQDNEAITIALDYGKKHNVNTIFINGDLIDNFQISKFESNPQKRSVKQEFDATKQFLVGLRKAFPSASIYWLKGNHCIRWEKFLLQKVKEIWDDPYYLLEERLRLNEEKITLIDDKVLVKIGKLSVSHGHLIIRGFFAPVSPARGAYMKAKQSILISHVHRASHHPEVTIDGEVISCWSTGSLAELKPDYSPLVSNYQHGFAHITVEKNGDYNVHNFQIIKGKIH